MIGDRAIFVAPTLAGSRHLFDCMTPVAPRAVHLEVASDVIGSHKGGQYTLLGSLDLAAVLPQLRWDPVHTKSAEDIVVLLPPDALAFFLRGLPVVEHDRDAGDPIRVQA